MAKRKHCKVKTLRVGPALYLVVKNPGKGARTFFVHSKANAKKLATRLRARC